MLKLKVYLLLLQMKADFHWNYTVRGMEKGRSQKNKPIQNLITLLIITVLPIMIPMDLKNQRNLNWLAVKQQFFTSIIESTNGFTKLKELKKR